MVHKESWSLIRRKDTSRVSLRNAMVLGGQGVKGGQILRT